MGTDAGAETGPYAVVSSGTSARGALAEQLFAANYPKLAGWVRRLVDDDDTAHEIASEAFVRLLSKWTSIDKLDNPQSYLFMIATNLVRDHWRKAERERRAMRNVSAGNDPEPSADPAQDVDVRELIAALPARLRDPFLLHYYAGFGIKEISALLKRPEGTIKADLYHARAKLKEAIAEREAAGAATDRATSDGEVAGAMRADDEHDPLDRWLNQQVQPLPPPPGTFELITRRARGRKLRKLAVTVVSAAAVAAAVAFAVPVGLNLHLTPPPTKAALSAAGSSSTSPARAVAQRERDPHQVAESVPLASATPTAVEPSAAPCPPTSSRPRSRSSAPMTGWVIGQAGTPGHVRQRRPRHLHVDRADRQRGPELAGRARPRHHRPERADRGERHQVPQRNLRLGLRPRAVGHRRRREAPGPRSTPTGRGSPTSRRPAAGPTRCSPPAATQDARLRRRLHQLHADDGRPRAATTGCRSAGRPAGSRTAATPRRRFSSSPAATATCWHRTERSTRAPSAAPGRGWAPRPASRARRRPTGFPAAAQLALASSTALAIACNGTSATTPPSVYTSDDGGALWTQPPAGQWSDISDLSDFGITTSLAAAPNGSAHAGHHHRDLCPVGRRPSAGRASNATGTGAPPGGFSYVGMTTDDQGVAVPADTSLHEIWMTFDGGQTWSPATSITPGN